MKIVDLFDRDHILIGLRVADKGQLLRELARRSAAALSLDHQMILSVLETRENLGSTGLGKGFALPHARLDTISAPYALFVRLARPIDFAAIDGRPVDLAVLLLTPANVGNEHLAILAAISRLMRDGELARQLRRAPDAAAVQALLSRA